MKLAPGFDPKIGPSKKKDPTKQKIFVGSQKELNESDISSIGIEKSEKEGKARTFC